MTPERWRQIEELYHAAAARPPDQRARFLRETCDVPELRQEVEALLKQPVSGDGLAGWEPIALTGSPSALASPMSGRTLGGYHLQGVLGIGGMGEVYRAHDAALGRDVAVKILPAALSTDPDRLARLEREARTLASLNHPNICAIYGVGEAEGIRFLVLELVEGQTLAEKLAAPAVQPSGLPLSEAVAIAAQIVDALEAAHDRGIVHRDLKPANIQITPGGVVKLLDFGLAKAMGSDAPPGLTHAPLQSDDGRRAGAVIGTAAYMSPEQARGLAVDGRTDVWAFGCVLYEMLTGRPAFSGDTASDTIAKILEHEPDWSALPVPMPPGIHRLLLRCLVKPLKARLKDIGDARLELDGVGEVAADVGSDRPAAPSRKWASPTSLLLSWLALAVLAVIVVIRELRRPETPPDNPLEHATTSKITNWEGTESGAVISPDGRFVIFLSDRERRFDLWLSQIGTNHFVNLTKDGPPLGPQGIVRSFGFSGDGEIWFTPPLTSGVRAAPRLMPMTPGGASRPFLGATSSGAAWSTDGTRLVYFDVLDGDSISVADRSGGDPRLILPAGKGRHNHHLTWSPDDRWIYYVSGYLHGLEGTDEMDIWRIKPSGGAPERVTRLNTAATFLTPLDPRTWLFVARSENRTRWTLWTFDAATKASRRVSSGLEQYTSVSASRDGRQIVATLSDTTVTLWQLPLRADVVSETDARPYTLSTPQASTPRFGGTSVFYLSAGAVGEGLYREQNGRTAQIWSGADGVLSEPAAVSRDGQHVALMLRTGEARQLAIMSADGTGRRRVARNIDLQGAPDWSPDGTFLVAGGSDARGPGLFKIPVNGDPPDRILEGEAVNPVLSPDGRVLVYGGSIVGGVAQLRAVFLDGRPLDLPPLRARPGGYRFMPDRTELLYLPNAQSQDFWSFDFATGKTRQVTRLSDLGRLRTFDISLDGKWILFDRSTEQSDVVLISRPK